MTYDDYDTEVFDEVLDDEVRECGNCGQMMEPEWVERHECFSQWNGPLVGERVKVATMSGVACWVEHDNEDDAVIVVMVGDDKRHRVDRSDITIIGDDDYCAGCGQLGPPFCFGYGPQQQN